MSHQEVKPVIHWFSPLPPARTDIAQYTARILPELSRFARVVLWVPRSASDRGADPTWDRAMEIFGPVIPFDATSLRPYDLEAAARLLGASADAPQMSFIHIGNSWVFHADLLTLARRLPSVVVLHDAVIQELLTDTVRLGLLARNDYIREMSEVYGPSAAILAEAAFEHADESLGSLLSYPGFELALSRAKGVIVHSAALHELLRQGEQRNLHLLPLPFKTSKKPPIFRRSRLKPLRLLAFGHLGPNRRLCEVIGHLADLKGVIDFHLDVIGEPWDTSRVLAEIEKHGLANQVTLRGYRPESELDDALRQAHLVFNLRSPTMGEASGSQLRIWNAGALSVVTDTGWYATLPEETVLKVPEDPDQERNRLVELITTLAERPDAFIEIAREGYAHLLRHHQPDQYAASIAQIARGTASLAILDLKRAAFSANPELAHLASLCGGVAE